MGVSSVIGSGPGVMVLETCNGPFGSAARTSVGGLDFFPFIGIDEPSSLAPQKPLYETSPPKQLQVSLQRRSLEPCVSTASGKEALAKTFHPYQALNNRVDLHMPMAR